jgi:hypothetical protein
LPELLLDERHDAAERTLVACAPGEQQRRDVGILARNTADSTPPRDSGLKPSGLAAPGVPP